MKRLLDARLRRSEFLKLCAAVIGLAAAGPAALHAARQSPGGGSGGGSAQIKVYSASR